MSNYRIEFNDGYCWDWYKVGVQTKGEAIEEAQALQGQPSEFDWPYRVVDDKTGKVVWPPIAVQAKLEL